MEDTSSLCHSSWNCKYYIVMKFPGIALRNGSWAHTLIGAKLDSLAPSMYTSRIVTTTRDMICRIT